MPEGDAVWRVCQSLHAALAGQRITDWALRWPTVATTDQRGATTLEVVPRGKHILHRLDSGVTLHSHLRMDGTWRVHDPRTLTRQQLFAHRVRAIVGCRTATALGCELGMLDVVRTADEHMLVGKLGPDLLGSDWDGDAAVTRLLTRPERPIAEALLDQRNLAGIGTIWNAETLFMTRTNPWTSVGALGAERLRALVDQAHRLLVASLAFPCSVSTGVLREPLYAYGRAERPCRRCRTPIVAGRVGEPPEDRIMYYCPRCQGVG